MKLNKTLTFAALVAGSLLVGSAVVQAQDSTVTTVTPLTNAPPANGVRPRGRMNMDRLVKELALTDEQKTNVQAALDDQRKQMGEIRSDDSLSQQDKRAKYKELRDGLNAKLKDILTPEQYDKWLKIAPGHRRPAPQSPPADSPPSTNAPAAAGQ